MRKILLSFIMLVMLTPSLACAMPICAESKQAVKTEQPPCAEHHSGSRKAESSGKVMLLIDCMGVDLQTADSPADLKKPDIKTDAIIYALADETLLSQVDYAVSKIRGPSDWYARSQIHPPIILTTQRFRI